MAPKPWFKTFRPQFLSLVLKATNTGIGSLGAIKTGSMVYSYSRWSTHGCVPSYPIPVCPLCVYCHVLVSLAMIEKHMLVGLHGGSVWGVMMERRNVGTQVEAKYACRQETHWYWGAFCLQSVFLLEAQYSPVTCSK